VYCIKVGGICVSPVVLFSFIHEIVVQYCLILVQTLPADGLLEWSIVSCIDSGRTEFETLEEVKRRARIARTFTR